MSGIGVPRDEADVAFRCRVRSVRTLTGVAEGWV